MTFLQVKYAIIFNFLWTESFCTLFPKNKTQYKFSLLYVPVQVKYALIFNYLVNSQLFLRKSKIYSFNFFSKAFFLLFSQKIKNLFRKRGQKWNFFYFFFLTRVKYECTHQEIIVKLWTFLRFKFRISQKVKICFWKNNIFTS